MKIIHVITAFGIGGAEKLLLTIINRQIESHEVHLIYLKPINDLISEVDSRVFVKQIPVSFSTIKDLSIYYHKVNADIIHTHLGHADVLGLWAARKNNAKIFCTLHNIYFKKNYLDLLFFKMYKYIFSKVVARTNVISISKSVESHVLHTLNVEKERSFLLYNAIPSSSSKCIKTNVEKPQLLFVGRLEKQKSVETLLKAVSYIREKTPKLDFEVIIVGDGSLKEQLIRLTKDLNIEDIITFTGKQQNVNSYYKKSNIFVLPSIWEGFGIVILEAFSAKLAVIASDIEGPSELIQNNKNGILFKPKNFIQLAEKMQLLIENKTLRESLAKEGYNTFTENFHIDTYVKRLEELYLNA